MSMNPKTYQFSKIEPDPEELEFKQQLLSEASDHNREAWDRYRNTGYGSGNNEFERKTVQISDAHIDRLAKETPTNELLSHIKNSDSPHDAIVREAFTRDDISDHLSDKDRTHFAMHSDPYVSHISAASSGASDEHRALHVLSNPECNTCKFQRP